MSLHVPTLFVALFMAIALYALALVSARGTLREQLALQRWAWGTWALAMGFAALSARVVLPDWVAVVCGNGLVFASLYLTVDALHHFVLHRGASRWLLAYAVLAWASVVAALAWPLAQRTALASLLYALQLVPAVSVIVRHGWQAERSLRTVAMTLGLTVLALGLRSVHALLYAQEYTGFFQASLGNGLTYLASFMFPLGAGFGFLLANLERSAQRLEQLATRDSLTGCVNRSVFDGMLRHLIERARREGSALSLLIMDLDHFKQINDRHGHQAGDAVLREVVQALRLRLRAADVFARLGGEEFGVILAGTDATGAMRAAEDLRATTEALSIQAPAGEALRVTVSLGASTLQGGSATTPEELYAQADQALYEAKRGGRNRALHQQQIGCGAADRRAASA